MSPEPTFYEDLVNDDIRVITVLDPQSNRWTTTVVGGPMDGWSTTYHEADDPVVQHATVIEKAREQGG